MTRSKVKSHKQFPASSALNEPMTLYISSNPLSNLIQKSRLGIRKNFLLSLGKKFAFNLSDLASIFHVSERTLQRYTSKAKLSTEISEKALILEELFERGIEILGSEDNFRAYIKTPNQACGGKAPVTFFDTTTGIQFISDELGRIEHGVY